MVVIVAAACAQLVSPAGSTAAAFAESYANSLLSIKSMDDPLPEKDMNLLFSIDLDTTQMHVTPDGSDSINVLAVFNPREGSGIGSVFEMYDRNISIKDSEDRYVSEALIYPYLCGVDGKEQLRVQVASSFPTGNYTLSVRGTFADANYSCEIPFRVLPALSQNFDDVLKLTDDMGRGIPSLMYLGNATIDYSAYLQVKEGSGLDRCEFDNVYFDNWSIINLYFNNDSSLAHSR